MNVTGGASRSIVYVGPSTGRVPARALPARSVIGPVRTSFSCNVPEPAGVPVPVEAVTVRVVALPVTAVIAGVPDRPLAASEKFPAPTPLTASANVTVQDTEVAFVGELPLRAIDTPPVPGGVVSNVYRWPVTGAEARALPAASWIVAFAVRSRPIDPLLLPVAPDVEAVTVHVVDVADPDVAAVVTVGAVPARLLVASVKLLVATLFTGSLNFTVQRSRLALVGFASARTIEETFGAVRSITQQYDVALLVWPVLSTAAPGTCASPRPSWRR